MSRVSVKKNFVKDINVYDIMVLLGMIVMFAATFYRLIAYGWRAADYTHAYFILPITLWLIWQKRSQLVQMAGVNKSGIWLFVVGILTYLYGAKNGFMFIEATSFVLVMWAVFWLRFTSESVKKIFFPLAYLIFLIPPPAMAIDLLSLPLKKISTSGAHFLLASFHLPAQVHGAILNVGGEELFMADACSGFRSIVTLLALGAVYAYLQNVSLLKKWIIFSFVIPLALLGNIFRITLTGAIAYALGVKTAMGFFHDFSGIILFAFTALCLTIVGSFVVRDEEDFE